MTFLEALRAARTRIESGRSQHICYALGAVVSDPRELNAFKKRVESQLHPQTSYGGWLQVNHPEAYNKMDYLDIRAGRLAWIDHMIAQEEAT